LELQLYLEEKFPEEMFAHLLQFDLEVVQYLKDMLVSSSWWFLEGRIGMTGFPEDMLTTTWCPEDMFVVVVGFALW
jgi:hypothetical protein